MACVWTCVQTHRRIDIPSSIRSLSREPASPPSPPSPPAALSLPSAETPRQAKEWESCAAGGKREKGRPSREAVGTPEEAERGPAGRRASYVRGRGAHIWLSTPVPSSAPSRERGQTRGKPSGLRLGRSGPKDSRTSVVGQARRAGPVATKAVDVASPGSRADGENSIARPRKAPSPATGEPTPFPERETAFGVFTEAVTTTSIDDRSCRPCRRLHRSGNESKS